MGIHTNNEESTITTLGCTQPTNPVYIQHQRSNSQLVISPSNLPRFPHTGSFSCAHSKDTKSGCIVTHSGLATATIPMRDDDGVYSMHHTLGMRMVRHTIHLATTLTSNRCSSKPIPSHYISNQLNTHCSLGHAHQTQNSIFETQFPWPP